MLCLGLWQLSRGFEKQSLIDAQRDAETAAALTELPNATEALSALRYRSVKLQGHFESNHALLLDNQITQGKIGYHVLIPFKMAIGQHILINLGWVPAASSRKILPNIPPLVGAFTIEGYLEKGYVNPLISKAIEEEPITWPLRVQKVDYKLFDELLGVSLLPMIVMLEHPAHSQFTPLSKSRKWLTPEKHFGYAFQWFSLAIALMVLCFLTLWKKKKSL